MASKWIKNGRHRPKWVQIGSVFGEAQAYAVSIFHLISSFRAAFGGPMDFFQKKVIFVFHEQNVFWEYFPIQTRYEMENGHCMYLCFTKNRPYFEPILAYVGHLYPFWPIVTHCDLFVPNFGQFGPIWTYWPILLLFWPILTPLLPYVRPILTLFRPF